MEKPGTLDITPTWTAIAPVLLDILKNPNAPSQATEIAKEEVFKMARAADKWVELIREDM